MYCNKCGEPMPDDAAFCPACGASQNLSVQQSYSNTANEPDMPMKWYKFLIYFALFAGAVLNILSGIGTLSTALVPGDAQWVYDSNGALKAFDLFLGIATIGLGVLGIYTRFRLAGYYSNGPKLLLMTYGASAAIQLIYAIVVYMAVGGAVNLTSTITSIVVSIIMIVLNKTYFDKRAHMFKND